MLWDIFCRVIDNFGDIGVCWRLSADLTQRGHQVRLWVDDASALAWMAPEQTIVEVYPWTRAEVCPPTPGDVVIESFGCNPPDAFVLLMQRPHPPCWINLEYLSAEDYVERSHGLASPVWTGAGAGLRKWFFYPGFTEQTGGLLREPDLLTRKQTFEQTPDARKIWLAQYGITVAADNLIVSVFCYDSAPLGWWLDALIASQRPESPQVTLLVTPGPATTLARQWLANQPSTGIALSRHVQICELPLLSQTEFDQLLWSADLNLVRGEDSAVRALWAGKPHIWQIYEQDDGVHADKLEAFMNKWMAHWDVELAQSIHKAWRDWNQLPQKQLKPEDLLELANPNGLWAKLSQESNDKLAKQVDLSTQLIEFVLRTG